MDVQTDLKGLVKAKAELLRRLDQSSSSIVGTMTVFLRRASLHILNQSSISTLIKRVAKGAVPPSAVGHSQSQHQSFSDFTGDLGVDTGPQDRARKNLAAQQWMTYVSKHCPALYKAHVGEIAKAIADEKNTQLVEVCLQALSAAAMWDGKLAPTDK